VPTIGVYKAFLLLNRFIRISEAGKRRPEAGSKKPATRILPVDS